MYFVCNVLINYLIPREREREFVSKQYTHDTMYFAFSPNLVYIHPIPLFLLDLQPIAA